MSLQRRVRPLPTWLLAAITASMAGAEELKWQEHIHKNGNFRVTMPGELVSQDDVELEGSDDVEMRTCHSVFKSGESGASFMAMSIKHSPEFLAKYAPAERISHRLDRTILDFHEKSPDVKFELHREPRVIHGYSGEYMRITLPGPELWEAHTVAFYAGEILYQAEVIVASKDSNSVLSPSDIEKFLSSFMLLAKTFETNDEVTSISISNGGRQVLLGCKYGVASLWDVKTGTLQQTYRIDKFGWKENDWPYYPTLKVALSPDTKHILTGTEGGTVTLWDAETGKEIRSFCQKSSQVQTVAFNGEGTLVSSHFYDDGVVVWDTLSGKQIAQFEVDNYDIRSYALSPDGRRVAIRLDDLSDSSRNKFQSYDIPSGKVLSEIHVSYPRDAAFSPDVEILATASGTDIRVWNVETGQELQRLDAFRLPGDAERIAFSNDGRLVAALASGYDQVNVRVWNLHENHAIGEFQRSKLSSEEITSISFTPDNRWVLVTGFGGERGFVHPWKLGLAKPGSFDSKPTGPQHGKAGRGRENERRRRESRLGDKGEAEVGGIPRSEVRTWTEANGTRTLRAEFLGGDEEHVKLRLENGKLATVRASLFSEQDQKFVREMLASRDRLGTTKAEQSGNISAVATTHLLSGRLEPGDMMTGLAKQPGFGVWTCRLGILDVESNSFQGVLYLDSVRVGRYQALVGASCEVEGLLSGRNTVQFTITRIRTRSRHPDVVLGDDNIGLAYRGAVRGNRIVGQAPANADTTGGSITMEFALPPTKVVALNKVTSSTQPND